MRGGQEYTELPDDFVERVNRLHFPAPVIWQLMRTLEEGERRDRMRVRLRAVREAWAALDPDLRPRYLEAMGHVPYLFAQPHDPQADPGDIVTRAKQMKPTPNEAAALWAERERNLRSQRRGAGACAG